jgi:predicted ribonuclease YlaK
MSLTEKDYCLLEETIATTKPSDMIIYGISIRDTYNCKREYAKLLQTNDVKIYTIFGSNGSGHTTYALYKASDAKIYLTQYSLIEESIKYKQINGEDDLPR